MKIILFVSLALTCFSSSLFANSYSGPAYGKKRSDHYFIERSKGLRNHKKELKVAQSELPPYGSEIQSQQPIPEPSVYKPEVGGNSAYQERPSYTKANPGTHYIALMGGFFLSNKASRWGNKLNEEDVGLWNIGVTYKVGEWENSMDLKFRADVQGFKADGERANKLSLLGMVTFPDVRSGFPLYFGGGLGLGVFFDQIDDESNLSFDYQIVIGGRINNVFEDIGIILEAGVKNHIFLTSKGQFNGYFLNAGAVFQF